MANKMKAKLISDLNQPTTATSPSHIRYNQLKRNYRF